MTLLHAGHRFPDLTVSLFDGKTTTLPHVFAGQYGAILFSPGASCRSCVDQMRAFQRSTERLKKAGIVVIALSTDDEVTTATLASKYGLTYPLGHSADPVSVSDATGAFVTLEPPQLHSTGFVIDPSGRVALSLYSCGAIGQLLPDDVLELVREARAEGEQR